MCWCKSATVLPLAFPCFNSAIIQVVLLPSVVDKFPVVTAIFLKRPKDLDTLKCAHVSRYRKHLLQWVSDRQDFKVPRTTFNWTSCCTCLVHEAKDRLHLRIWGRDTEQQGIFVAPQQFIHSASREKTNLGTVHPHGQQTGLPETVFQLVHYSLETGSTAERRKDGKEFMGEAEGGGGIEETIY